MAPVAPHATSTSVSALGLIAGSKSLPLELARLARQQGVQRIVAVGFKDETDPALASLVDHLTWVRVGQLSPIIKTFRDHRIHQCVMAGQVAPRNLYDVRPDLRALGIILRLKERNAHTLFGAVADELRKDGIELIEATPWLRPLMPAAGFRMGPHLPADRWDDVAFGFRVAKAVSQLEIGQTVVVKEGTVLAVEAFEGTDQCLRRGGELAGTAGGALGVKVARENHDMRFDIPCLGPQTLQVAIDAHLRAIVFEGGKTLLLERQAMQTLAARHGVTVLAADASTHGSPTMPAQAPGHD